MLMATDERELRAQMQACGLPDMHNGLLLYLREGIPPGSFLLAVLENDLSDAAIRADATNRALLFNYTTFLRNHAPLGAWGSPEKVDRWMRLRLQEREARLRGTL